MSKLTLIGTMPPALVEEFLKHIGEFHERHRQDARFMFMFDCPELSVKEVAVIMERVGVKRANLSNQQGGEYEN